MVAVVVEVAVVVAVVVVVGAWTLPDGGMMGARYGSDGGYMMDGGMN